MSREQITARFEVLKERDAPFLLVRQRKQREQAIDMMWMRHCPHCGNKMCKYTLQYSIALCEVRLGVAMRTNDRSRRCQRTVHDHT